MKINLNEAIIEPLDKEENGQWISSDKVSIYVRFQAYSDTDAFSGHMNLKLPKDKNLNQVYIENLILERITKMIQS